MPHSGMYMSSVVTNEQCEQINFSVVKELEINDPGNVAEDSTRYGFDQGHVAEVTTMNQTTKCEMILNGQKPTLEGANMQNQLS